MSSDVDTLIRRSARLDLHDLDFSVFKTDPLDADTLRCLRYMHDVEHHTICYLRDLLVTRAHRDPEVTAFLACWSYEEYWHGDALAQVLAVHDEDAGRSRVAAVRAQLPRRDTWRPLWFGIASALDHDLLSTQMAWGAVNEWTTQAGYARLADRAGHPVLSDLLGRIMRQEGRHIDFYTGQAASRLAASRSARRIARFTLRRYWAPVGSGLMPPAEVSFLTRHLFSGSAGLETARRIDRHLDRLPGLAGLHLLETTVRSQTDLGEAA